MARAYDVRRLPGFGAIALLTFVLLGLAYVVVTIEKVRWCVRIGLEQCQ